MELAIAASNIDQYTRLGRGELPDDLKNLVTKKIVEPKPTVDFAKYMHVEYLFKNQGRTVVCLPCSCTVATQAETEASLHLLQASFQAETESMEEVLD